MSKHLQKELDNIKRDLLLVGSLVKDIVEKSIVSFYDSRVDLAEEVIKEDDQIDEKEVEIEEECLKLLALHQPVAQDLRFLTTVMKINNDLELMGDSAVSIARRSKHYAKRTPMEIPQELRLMVDQALDMVQKSLKSFVEEDVALAHAVCAQDDEVDMYQAKVIGELKKNMKSDSNSISVALDVFTIARRVERIADLATNISEDVIYMVDGEIVRHFKNKIDHESE